MKTASVLPLLCVLSGLVQAQGPPPSGAAPNTTLTAVGGIKVGHHTLTERPTGCTVILVDGEGAVGGVAQRGGAPGTRETDLLDPANMVGLEGKTNAAGSGSVNRSEKVSLTVAAVVTDHGTVACETVVNAAGIIGSGTVETTTDEQWDVMIDINVRAPFRLMRAAVPALVAAKGSVVNVSSVTGLRSFPGVLAYCVSKAGVDQLTRCAALELAPKGVRVNAVNPGVVVSNLHRRGGMNEESYAAFLEHSKGTHPLGRPGEAPEIADLIFFLASPQAGWITGETISIDGGRHLTCAR